MEHRPGLRLFAVGIGNSPLRGAGAFGWALNKNAPLMTTDD